MSEPIYHVNRETKMKFLNAQGHFGVLDGRKLRFEDGLNVLYLPNEGGKTTLCHFLRVMLYG